MTEIPAATMPSGPATEYRRLVVDASAAAQAAADAAGCRVGSITALAELEAVCRLFEDVWKPDGDNGLVTTELLRALDKAGNYIAAAFDVDELVGACIGFFGPPPDGSLHSHIAGVSARMRGRSVGFALKTHQRSWALQRGATQVSWTFDPLIRRNAYFNIGKLAALPVEYLPNFYGRMNDSINAGDDTDRLVVSWRLDSAEVAAACHGRHQPVDAARACAAGAVVALGTASGGHPAPGRISGPRALVAVPEDIETLRRHDPKAAAAWRSALRDALGGMLAEGWRVTGFDRAGWYILVRRDAQ
jgi:predicted GNAT superfamily acetyltransferase